MHIRPPISQQRRVVGDGHNCGVSSSRDSLSRLTGAVHAVPAATVRWTVETLFAVCTPDGLRSRSAQQDPSPFPSHSVQFTAVRRDHEPSAPHGPSDHELRCTPLHTAHLPSWKACTWCSRWRRGRVGAQSHCRTGRKCSQLPKLIVRATHQGWRLVTGRSSQHVLTDGTGP